MTIPADSNRVLFFWLEATLNTAVYAAAARPHHRLRSMNCDCESNVDFQIQVVSVEWLLEAREEHLSSVWQYCNDCLLIHLSVFFFFLSFSLMQSPGPPYWKLINVHHISLESKRFLFHFLFCMRPRNQNANIYTHNKLKMRQTKWIIQIQH